MAFIDRLKYTVDEDTELVHKHPSDKLVLGTQLIVTEGQEAVFVKGGRALDVFGPGTHTLATANLPLLQALINLPFGGKTPFTAEVFFVNRHAKLDMFWGTTEPFLVTDPMFQIIVPVTANGQFGLRVKDSRSLVTQIVGAQLGLESDKLSQYFEGLLVSKLKDQIARVIVGERVSVLDVSARLEELSARVRTPVEAEFERFGLEVLNLFIRSISVRDGDASLKKLSETLANRAELLALGEGYRLKRTFDVLQTTAENPGGPAGTFLSGGLGLGIGLGAGSAIGTGLATALNPSGPATTGPIGAGACPSCGAAVAPVTRFCAKCGKPTDHVPQACGRCGNTLPPQANYCPKCGEKKPEGGNP